MPERLTQAERSRVMAAIKSRDTAPERVVRKIVHRLGYRFRLHRRDLPGTPDIVLPRLKKVINIHGCFWHMHSCKHGRRSPVKNADYWNAKRARNVARDKKVSASLRRLGWRVLTIWECQMSDADRLTGKLATFLKSGNQASSSRP